jgi:thiol:disulfide interchange protein DsbD
MIPRIIVFSFLLLFAAKANGQIEDPVQWSFDSEKISNTEYFLIYKAEIEEGWSVYSQSTSKNGPVPTEITYYSYRVRSDGIGEEIGHKKEGIDPIFGINVIKFLADEDFIIKHRVTVEEGVSTVKGFLTYMVCDDSKCLPPTDVEIEITVE